jgi:flagellar biosynthesis protein FlhF
MQVKKFEAPTIQEALDTIKRELGPEAIILSTKKHKRGFGLMSQASVEVTAAVSERAIQKKAFVEKRVPEPTRQALSRMGAERQAQFIDKYTAPRPEKQSYGRSPAQGSSADLLTRAAQTTRDQVDVRSAQQARPANPRQPSPPPAPPARARAAGSMQHAGGQLAEPPRSERAGLAEPPRSERAGLAEPPKVTSRRYIDIEDVPGKSVEEELRQLKRMVEEMKSQEQSGGSAALAGPAATAGALSTPALQDAFDQMVINGIDKRYALSLIRKVGFELGGEASSSPDHVLDQLACEIMATTETLRPLAGIVPGQGAEQGKGPLVVALVGPTGVGKTTTVAKMASDALLKRGLKVGLINLDCYKVAAFDQLSTYAKILNVPFRSASSAEDYQAAVGDFRGLDVVFVDTTGRSQRDPSSLKEMEALLRTLPSVQTQLVLSATTRDNELYDMASRFSVFRPQGVIVSKLDEASIYGAIYNVSQKVKLPLIYFTTGQRVPEDLEEASKERVAALVLDL